MGMSSAIFSQVLRSTHILLQIGGPHWSFGIGGQKAMKIQVLRYVARKSQEIKRVKQYKPIYCLYMPCTCTHISVYIYNIIIFMYTGSGDIDHMMLFIDIWTSAYLQSTGSHKPFRVFQGLILRVPSRAKWTLQRLKQKYLLITEIPHKFDRQAVCPITIHFWDYTVSCGAGFCPRTGSAEFIRWTCNSRGLNLI